MRWGGRLRCWHVIPSATITMEMRVNKSEFVKYGIC